MKEENRKYLRQLADASSVGLQFVLSIFIGILFGRWLDKTFDSSPLLTLIFLVFGIAAGFLNYYRFAVKQRKEDEKGSGK
ncbi:AtpZ/AtpI family protein [Syntrophobacter fumaroxidans]|uniref:ATP synthase protein I n=1 Tax=Syntrophobacter fumaroxidans (strain DSM 10017 / MPOB) TaxID=335543 RepID=A0LIP2_SYNFM|nr:AtpZ/AtpI family protein [Syntrophobacter fumaroxidans]ABK17294.1 conserved hypothetical protein [Syntrophobacter fumaroxidans MPOB]HOI93657.1 AtpZ/AtpI family protein [Syntrophobacter fumaroxidans]